MSESIVVDFPLHGEWTAPNTPAHCVPSHGTDEFAQRYAYDFIRLGWEDGRPGKFSRRGALAYLFCRVRLEDCYGWGAGIHSPFAGKIVKAADGWPERRRVNLFSDIWAANSNARAYFSGKSTDIRTLGGNHIIIEGHDCFAFIAHAKTGSIRCREDDTVKAGDLLAQVGHSGNSTCPHLHFHLMDSPDPTTANGLPCSFRNYETFENDRWHLVEQGMPERGQRVRSLPADS